MSTLYIIIGNSRSHKSSTIKALTGFSRGYNAWLVATIQLIPRKVFIISASPQEVPETFKKHLESIKEGGQDTDVLMALHPDDQALGFITQLQERHEREVRWVFLGKKMSDMPDELKKSLCEPDEVIENAPEQPANAIAHQIRRLWGWL